ncbi:dimethylarginine dimethylaminohydrolase family protein [Candidatus Nitrotoga sp. AM1P]|uniref:dimethylarginine dimethylaminohydrolase family protein n=1 Tax=Candidatus Nitrotoga sp. AM1P TaxID=2559597 RepID=UPI001567B43A|nr:arginine deiminase family protein [Candidatus Nitrotoga sp. AM1P]
MKIFLMCDPRYFEVSYVINPWMAGNQGRENKKLAAKQWKNLYDILSRKASIKLIEPVAGLPDMVFTANGGFVYRDHEVIVSSFRYPERQGESSYFSQFFENSGYRIKRLNSDIQFEGAGDALYDSNGRVWIGYGHRSDVQALDEIATILQAQVNGLTLVDPRWYHLDTAFCPLVNGYVLAYEQAFTSQSVNKIKNEFNNRVIWVSDEDANNFACNAVNIGNDIILYKVSNELKATLSKHNFSIIEVDVSEFMKAGGACKCLTLEL